MQMFLKNFLCNKIYQYVYCFWVLSHSQKGFSSSKTVEEFTNIFFEYPHDLILYLNLRSIWNLFWNIEYEQCILFYLFLCGYTVILYYVFSALKCCHYRILNVHVINKMFISGSFFRYVFSVHVTISKYFILEVQSRVEF